MGGGRQYDATRNRAQEALQNVLSSWSITADTLTDTFDVHVLQSERFLVALLKFAKKRPNCTFATAAREFTSQHEARVAAAAHSSSARWKPRDILGCLTNEPQNDDVEVSVGISFSHLSIIVGLSCRSTI